MIKARSGRCIASPLRYTGRKGAVREHAMQNTYTKEVNYESGIDHYDREVEESGAKDCKAERKGREFL